MTRELGRSSDRRRLEMALEAAGLGEFEFDFTRDLFIVSERMTAITGIPAGSRPAKGGEALDDYVHPDDLAEFRARRVNDSSNGDSFEMTFRQFRPDDGRLIWVRVGGVIERGEHGQPVYLLGIVQDVTQLHREEERRLQAMAELDHRVKNVLAAVQALAQQTAKRTTTLDGFLQAFNGRLKAMASANELLTAARWRGAAIDHLAAAELGAIAPGQTRWSGPELFLTPRAANALSLALHELATNARKYGAFSNAHGQLSVRWRIRESDGQMPRLVLEWVETGIDRRHGTGSGAPKNGYGRELIENALPYALDATTRYELGEAEVRCLIELPLA